MRAWVLFTLITAPVLAWAAQTDSPLVGYVPDPRGRGTPSLLVSCILTLIVCVWSALHLNVPPRTQSTSRNILLNAQWIIAGMYAPEMVVFVAWRQWSSARLLQKMITEAADGKAGPSTDWTMTHSFFACTGGFAFEFDELDLVQDAEQDREAMPTPRLTLTARGVALLARCGHLPHVPREEIDDKSKANSLAKTTVLLQATWMLIQAVGRLIAGLPVTLLEVNTVAHVLCALSMYILWWHKPLLPQQPIILRDKELIPLATFMYSSSEMSGYLNPTRVRSQTWIKTLFAHLSLYSKTPELETLCIRTTFDPQTAREGNTSPLKKTGSLETVSGITFFHQAPNDCLAILQAQRRKDTGTAFFERRPRVLGQGTKPSVASKRRWLNLAVAIDTYPQLMQHDRLLLRHHVGRANCVHLKPEQLMVDHVGNWPSSDLLRDVDGLVVGMVLWLANFVYGGIHMAAWNDHFPTEAEKWLWRGSSSYIAFCGGLWVVLNFAVSRIPKLNEFLGTLDGREKIFGSKYSSRYRCLHLWVELGFCKSFHCGGGFYWNKGDADVSLCHS
uniref:Wax synthase domain-containing protein n=1 Tax=Pyricularia oryzae (strain P131) TaxID=1143193 RepID=L7J1S9_PYRO1